MHFMFSNCMQRLFEWVNLLSCWNSILFLLQTNKQTKNKLHKNGSIWVESNVSKWKGKCGRESTPKECACKSFTMDSNTPFSIVAPLIDFRDTKPFPIPHFKRIHPLIRYVLFTYIFFFLSKIPRDFMLFYFNAERIKHNTRHKSTRIKRNTRIAKHNLAMIADKRYRILNEKNTTASNHSYFEANKSQNRVCNYSHKCNVMKHCKCDLSLCIAQLTEIQ